MKHYKVVDRKGNVFGEYADFFDAINARADLWENHPEYVQIEIKTCRNNDKEKEILKRLPKKVGTAIRKMRSDYRKDTMCQRLVNEAASYVRCLNDLDLLTDKETKLMYLYIIDW